LKHPDSINSRFVEKRFSNLKGLFFRTVFYRQFCGVDPAAVDEWYLGIYIDAIQWVELPNTRAMSQFADGGQVATKPYISSAKYIHSMSDYCNACAYQWKQRHGDMACPFNSLYWNFFEQHRHLLQKNPRVGMMYRVWDRMESKEKKLVLKQADTSLKNLNRL